MAYYGDSKYLICHIRNKFKFRSLTKGSLVLISLREWEAPNYKECDLLYVYEPHDIPQLSAYDLSFYHAFINGGYSSKVGAEDITFSDNVIAEEDLPTNTKTMETKSAAVEELIDIDSI